MLISKKSENNQKHNWFLIQIKSFKLYKTKNYFNHRKLLLVIHILNGLLTR